MFSDKISCDAMANPGEEMVCGQCGQTILGKAMKVVIYSIYVLCIIMYIMYYIFHMYPNCPVCINLHSQSTSFHIIPIIIS